MHLVLWVTPNSSLSAILIPGSAEFSRPYRHFWRVSSPTRSVGSVSPEHGRRSRGSGFDVTSSLRPHAQPKNSTQNALAHLMQDRAPCRPSSSLAWACSATAPFSWRKCFETPTRPLPIARSLGSSARAIYCFHGGRAAALSPLSLDRPHLETSAVMTMRGATWV